MSLDVKGLLKRAGGLCLFMLLAWAFTEAMVKATRDPLTPTREMVATKLAEIPIRLGDNRTKAPQWIDNGGPVGFYQAFRTGSSSEEIERYFRAAFERAGWVPTAADPRSRRVSKELRFCKDGYSASVTIRGGASVSYIVQLFWTRDRGSADYCPGKPAWR